MASFASGFRAGTDAIKRRSNMPLIQGMGSMINMYQGRRPQGGGVRYASDKGPSKAERSYERYRRRKMEDEAIEEEQWRYKQEQRRQEKLDAENKAMAEREMELTEAQDARAGEAHESQIKTEEQQREQVRSMSERTKKKEGRIENYRGLRQGVASENKAMVEEFWAALAGDMPSGKGWSKYKESEVTDPKTGEKHRKFTIRDGGMPAPSVDFLPDGSVSVTYPDPDGDGPGKERQVIYESKDELNKKVISFMNPEFETEKERAARVKEDRYQTSEKRREREERRKVIKAKIEAVERKRESGKYTDEQADAELDELDKEMAALDPDAGEDDDGGENKDVIDFEGQRVFAGEKPPKGAPKDAKKDPDDGYWYVEKDGQKIPLISKF